MAELLKDTKVSAPNGDQYLIETIDIFTGFHVQIFRTFEDGAWFHVFSVDCSFRETANICHSLYERNIRSGDFILDENGNMNPEPGELALHTRKSQNS